MNPQIEKIKKRFKEVEKTLNQKPWFKKEKWIISIHAFPNDKKPEAITLHVFKKHWWNVDRKGIHIESYLDLNEKKQKKTHITLHLLHTPLVPGTKLKRTALSKPFVDAIFDEVKQWPGYKFRAGKYGTQPFTYFLDGSKPEFESELAVEVSRICTKLGPQLERCLKELV